jgi:hypothetical protein
MCISKVCMSQNQLMTATIFTGLPEQDLAGKYPSDSRILFIVFLP